MHARAAVAFILLSSTRARMLWPDKALYVVDRDKTAVAQHG